jgi:hypothetical protein
MTNLTALAGGSSRLQDMNGSAGRQIFHLSGIGFHVWRNSVRAQGLKRLPFFDNYKSVLSEFCKSGGSLRVDNRLVCETARFCSNGWDVCAVCIEYAVAHPRLGSNDCEYVDH